MIMKTIFSALLALSLLAAIAPPASADANPWNPPHDPANSPN
jgi:hypothetical protein